MTRRAYEKTRTVRPEQLGRILAWALRLGFKDDQSAEWMLGGWRRLYNLRNAAPAKIYAVGAVGLQVEWRCTGEGETAQVKVWRN